MNDLQGALDILYTIIKLMMIVFSFLHLAGFLVIWRQAKLASDTVVTKSRAKLMLLLSLHAIVLLIVLILIVILPS